VALVQKLHAGVGADISGPAGDKYFHCFIPVGMVSFIFSKHSLQNFAEFARGIRQNGKNTRPGTLTGPAWVIKIGVFRQAYPEYIKP
jgi:hypothetical protein